MDTSAEYVLMCQKATEIQEFAPNLRARNNDTVRYEEGNWYAQGDIVGLECRYWREPVPLTWLPRQDQLQEMIAEPLRSRIAFGDVVLGSWEQFYLHIVMYEKYGKRWDSTGWVKGE